MGLADDTHLRSNSNDFTWAATAFSIAYLAAEIPTGTISFV